MSLPDFDLRIPKRLNDALALLREAGPGGLALAGGSDLIPLMKQGVLSPRIVVALSGVAELAGIRLENGSISIGGGATLAAIEASPLLAEHVRALVDAAERMATVQVRNVATAAGNLASAAACGDLAPVLISLGARLRLRSASGERTVSLTDFFTGPRATVLLPGELICEILMPVPERGSGSAYTKYGYRGGSQIAVVSAAAAVVQENGKARSVRLVLGAVAPVPFAVQGAAVLVGGAIEGAALDSACAAAGTECQPISDIRGSWSYRRTITSVIARRALLSAWRRSLGREV